jgi:hypothetical protein
MDRAGALLAGTIGVSFVLTLARSSATGSLMQSAMLAFVAGAAIASVIPLLPPVARGAVQRIGDAGFVALLAVAVAGGPALGASAAVAAIALFVATVGAAALVARIAGVDLRSAVAGAGSRDPAVATAVAITIGGPAAAGVPLYCAVLLLVLGATFVALNRRKAR